MKSKDFSDNTLINNISTVTLFDLASKISNFFLIILFIRVLSVEEYALLTLFISISAILNGAISNGLNLSYVRYDVEQYSRTSNYSNLFIVNLVIKISLLIVIFILYFTFEDYLSPIIQNNQVFYYTVLYSLGLALMGTINSYFQVREKFVQNGLVINIKNLLLFTVCIIIYYLYSLSFEIVAVSYIWVTWISLFFVIYIIVKSDFKKVSKSVISDYIKTSFWLLVYSLLISLMSQIDILIVSMYLTKVEVANFGVAFRYYGMLLSLLPSIAIVLRIRTSKKDLIDSEKKQRDFILNWIKNASKMVIPIILVSIIVTPLIFPIVNGEEYNNAILPFQILCIGAAISYIFSPNVAIIMAMKKYRLLCAITFLALTLNVVGNILIIEYLGIIGVSIVTILTHAFLNITIVFYILKTLSKS